MLSDRRRAKPSRNGQCGEGPWRGFDRVPPLNAIGYYKSSYAGWSRDRATRWIGESSTNLRRNGQSHGDLREHPSPQMASSRASNAGGCCKISRGQLTFYYGWFFNTPGTFDTNRHLSELADITLLSICHAENLELRSGQRVDYEEVLALGGGVAGDSLRR